MQVQIVAAALAAAVGITSDDAFKTAAEECKGFPDGAKVTITIQRSSKVEPGDRSEVNQETLSFTLTCGELRQAVGHRKAKPSGSVDSRK